MAELFVGTPAIVGVTISDQEGKQVTYHIAGRDMEVVKEAVADALRAIPAEDDTKTPHKAKRTRRTKAQIEESIAKPVEGATKAKSVWPEA